VVIGTDCICNCKSNYMYHMITTMLVIPLQIQIKEITDFIEISFHF
jgi:hypothetical protein